MDKERRMETYISNKQSSSTTDNFDRLTAEAMLTEEIIQPSLSKGRWFYFASIFFVVLLITGIIAWVNQLMNGLGVTGMKNSVNWGIYITNFVFFIGISHAGTLISAILRITQAEWRRPITRAAEAVTVCALIVGGLQIIIDLGQPQRLFNVIIYGRLGSPLIWDVICISVYLISCLFFLLLPLIPDMGLLKSRAGLSKARKKLYRILAFNWTNNAEQKRRLEKAMRFITILIIPIAVSVHTVVSWIFGMTVRPMWHSTILGPYFVVGAIFSGVAAVVITLFILRKVYKLENYIKPVHFNKLGLLLITMASLWFYFTFSEFLTTGYGALTEESTIFSAKISGEFSIIFWIMIIFMALAFVFLLLRKKNTIRNSAVASFFIIMGMWIERYIIIIPTLTKSGEEGYKAGFYYPNLTEWLITLGSFAGFILLYMAFAKLFPVISIWEIKGAKKAIQEQTYKMESYIHRAENLKTQKQFQES